MSPSSALGPPMGVHAHPAGVLLATLKASTQHVLQDDGLLAGDDGILVVVGITGLGVNERQLQLLESEGWREHCGGSRRQSSAGTLWPTGSQLACPFDGLMTRSHFCVLLLCSLRNRNLHLCLGGPNGHASVAR